MGKLVKLVIVVAIIVVAGYFVVKQMDSAATGPSTDAQGDPPVKVEEKYGFSTGLDGD